jgi:hypothetical protein
VFAGCLTERSGSRMKVAGVPSQTDKLRYAARCLFHACGKMYLSHVPRPVRSATQDQGLCAVNMVGACGEMAMCLKENMRNVCGRETGRLRHEVLREKLETKRLCREKQSQRKQQKADRRTKRLVLAGTPR